LGFLWCGPSLGAFNDWSRGTYLEQPENRHVADVALQILTGAAYLARVRLLELYGVELQAELRSSTPRKAYRLDKQATLKMRIVFYR